MAFACNSLVISGLRVEQGDGVWLCASNDYSLQLVLLLLLPSYAELSKYSHVSLRDIEVCGDPKIWFPAGRISRIVNCSRND